MLGVKKTVTAFVERRRKQGFALVEILLVIGIMSAATGYSVPMYRNYKIRSDLYLARDVVTQALYRARLLSQTGQQDDEWRYNIPEGIVFKGADYEARDTDFDELFPLPSAVTATGLTEIAFSRVTGVPSPDGDIVLEAINGEKIWISISPDTAIAGDSAPPLRFMVIFERLENNLPGGSDDDDDSLLLPRNVVFVGSGSTEYAEGEWIPLTEDGVTIIDDDLNFYEPGMYAQRRDGYVEIVHYGGIVPGHKVIIDADVRIDNGFITDVEDGEYPDDSENPFNGVENDGVGGDEVTMASDNKSLLFQTRESMGKDTIHMYWNKSPSQIVFVASSSSSSSSSSTQSSVSSSVTSSSSSSVSSSTSSSSDSGGGGGTACEDLFYVDADGTITTTGTVEATVQALGSAITYGVGGPEIAVRADISLDGGDSWTDLFNNAEIDGGEVDVYSNIASGKQIVVKINGKYTWWFWTLFNSTYQTNDGTGHIQVLRDGEEPPNYEPFGNQDGLEVFLQSVIDESGKIDIGEYDVVLLAELDTVSDDYQDAVILISFELNGACE